MTDEKPKRPVLRRRKLTPVNLTVDGEAMPLDYMLAVMRDNSVDVARRDRMAVAAAPYLHAKPSETGALGKKEQAAIDAGRPDTSTEIGRIMQERIELAAETNVIHPANRGTLTFRGRPVC
mgnify:CR=1 FL=1